MVSFSSNPSQLITDPLCDNPSIPPFSCEEKLKASTLSEQDDSLVVSYSLPASDEDISPDYINLPSMIDLSVSGFC